MCGICGEVGRVEVDPAVVERMNSAIVHRGPDAGGVTRLGRCVLGYRRLAVVDLVEGDQPARSEDDSVTAVFNGELYSFRDVRDELARTGHAVPGSGDTAVIPHVYEESGPSFPERLDGMFAIAVWDAARGRLVLARDRVGKKPLLYTTWPDGSLAFASELKALLQHPRLERRLDPRALDAYLALQYVPGPATALEGVLKVPPGHVLVWEDGRHTVTPYWSLEPRPQSLDDEEWLERTRAEVRAAVRRRLVADVPLGALLSGGIDSSIVVGLMAEASTEPVRTFTVGFSDRRYDEREPARIAASAFGTRHEELHVELDPAALLDDLAWTVDEPLGDEALLPTLLISRVARKHVTVALVGDGGDEAFAGYERYAAMRLADRMGRVPLGARAGARALRLLPAARRVPRSAGFRLARLLDVAGTPPAHRYGAIVEVFAPGLRRELFAGTGIEAQAAHAYLGPPPVGLTGLQLLDARTYLPWDLLPKSDLASMAASLEVRAPFLDHRVLELGVSLPEHLRVDGRVGKIALRRAFADLLPEELRWRGKSGFGVPIAGWFRHELRDLARDALLAADASTSPWLRRPVVERLLAEHVAGRADHGHRLWCLLVLELWLRSWVDSAAVPAAPADVAAIAIHA
ncbi:MAG: asparagine synthase (glutamine-hydrolyzing) [Actinobacteria bacterium]|nr:asparagine synthase (glutamine-hydrolyzing) [Actinomycetota bacterium]